MVWYNLNFKSFLGNCLIGQNVILIHVINIYTVHRFIYECIVNTPTQAFVFCEYQLQFIMQCVKGQVGILSLFVIPGHCSHCPI